MKFKENIRVLGIDDAFLDEEYSIIIGAIFRGKSVLEGVISSKIQVDGLDSTEKIIEMLFGSGYERQIRVMMLDGITFGGFNVVDIKELFGRTEIPVMAFTRKMPNFTKIYEALGNLDQREKRIKIIKNGGAISEFKFDEHKIFYQKVGIEKEEVEEIIKEFTINSLIPEPVRVAHLISSGIARGRSTNRA